MGGMAGCEGGDVDPGGEEENVLRFFFFFFVFFLRRYCAFLR